MKNYERKTTFRRDLVGRDGRQMLMPWSGGKTISTVEAGDRMGVNYDTVRDMAESGEIQGWPLRPGKKKSPWRISVASVELWLERKLANYDIGDPELHRRMGLTSLPKQQTQQAQPVTQKAK